MRPDFGRRRFWAALAATAMGLGASGVSAAGGDLSWIASLCGIAGNGCHQAAAYDLAGISLGLWGLLFYFSLILAWMKRPALTGHMVMAGAGAEAVFLVTMMRDHFFCLICGINALAVGVLLACFFPRKRLSAGLTACFGTYVLVHAFMAGAPVDPRLPSNPVLARVGGTDLFSEEVNQPIAGKLEQLNKAIYRLKKKNLEDRVCSTILAGESAKEGISPRSLKQKILSDLPGPADETVSYYFTTGLYKRLGKWTGSSEQIKEKIRADLTRRMGAEKIRQFCLGLEADYDVQIFLSEPALPVTRVPVAQSPSMGPEDAPVTVVEFSDYLCPSCRKGHEKVRQIREKYRGRVRWVFKDFPLKIHPGADQLALAARCAGEQGRFWDYQEALFAGQAPDNPLSLVRRGAHGLGLDMKAFDRCMADPAQKAGLEKEVHQARQAGISMTPSFIINGRLFGGLPDPEKFTRLIDPLLEESGS